MQHVILRSEAERYGYMAMRYVPGATTLAKRMAVLLVDGQRNASTGQADDHRDKIQRAIEYRTAILDLIEQYKATAFAEQLVPIKTRLDRWERHLRELTEKLTAFETNHIIQRDLREVPAAIQRLQTQKESTWA